jgi:Intracellular proteinase inhibitor
MRRTNGPNVESLEARSLLSGTAGSSLAVSLTAETQATSSGTQVVFTFVETNVSHNNVNVAYGPGTDGFVVSENGKPVWVSNPGPQPQFEMLQTLKPGQSLTLHATWDDRSNQVDPADPSIEGPPLSGTFTVENELDRGYETPFTVSNAQTTTHVTPTTPHVTASTTHVSPPRPAAHRVH